MLQQFPKIKETRNCNLNLIIQLHVDTRELSTIKLVNTCNLHNLHVHVHAQM